MTYLGFFVATFLVIFLESGVSFEEVGEARISKGSWVIDLVVVHAHVGIFEEVVDSWFSQDEGCLVSDRLAYVREGRELVIQVMFPVGNIIGCEMHS